MVWNWGFALEPLVGRVREGGRQMRREGMGEGRECTEFTFTNRLIDGQSISQWDVKWGGSQQGLIHFG